MPPRNPLVRLLRAGVSSAVLCAASAAPCPAADTQAELDALLKDAASPRLAESTRSAEGVRLDVGRLHLNLSEGFIVPVQDGAGTVGFFFTGRGEASWDTAGAIAPAAFEHNLDELVAATARARRREASHPQQGLADVAARFPVTEALLLSSRDWATPAGSAGHAGPAKPLPAAARETFARLIREIGATGGWDHPVRRLAARLEPGPEVTRVDLVGRSRIVARIDGMSGLATISAVRATLPDPPSEETIGAFQLPGTAPVPPARLDSLALSLKLGEPPALAVGSRLALVPRPGAALTRLLVFRLDQQEYEREVLPTDPGETVRVRSQVRLSGPAIRVRSVRDRSGTAYPFVHSCDLLTVLLTGAGLPSDGLQLDIETDTDLARLPGGFEFFTLRQPGWFPVPDRQRERFGFACAIVSHAPFLPIAGGVAAAPAGVVEQEVTPEQAAPAWTTAGLDPMRTRLPILAIGRYLHAEAVAEQQNPPDTTPVRTPVRVWAYATVNPQSEPIARFCASALAFYSRTLGPYPFDRLDVVESLQASGGLSGPGIVLAEGMDAGELAWTRRFLGASAFNMLFAHEIAHQWWGQKVAIAQTEDQWLIEALSEYSAWLFVRSVREELGERVLIEWRRRAATSADVVPVSQAWALSGDLASLHRANLSYGKGALMLRALARETGEEKFIAALGVAARSLAGHEVTAEQFLAALERESGKPLTALWELWTERTGLPADQKDVVRKPLSLPGSSRPGSS